MHDDMSHARRSETDVGAPGLNPGAETIGRALDVIIAVVALFFLLPIMIAVAVAVLLTDGGPVVFAHRRIGRDGKEFNCYKFRSMVKDSEERLARLLSSDREAFMEWQANHKLRNDPRITRIGAFLRKSSFDELPQIFNVLVGEMSLVGPRPIVRSEVHHYGRYFAHYCAIRPGITGLWQISGRSNTDYRRRVALDVAYCRSKCLGLDMRILVMTVPAILLSRGAY